MGSDNSSRVPCFDISIPHCMHLKQMDMRGCTDAQQHAYPRLRRPAPRTCSFGRRTGIKCEAIHHQSFPARLTASTPLGVGLALALRHMHVNSFKYHCKQASNHKNQSCRSHKFTQHILTILPLMVISQSQLQCTTSSTDTDSARSLIRCEEQMLEVDHDKLCQV